MFQTIRNKKTGCTQKIANRISNLKRKNNGTMTNTQIQHDLQTIYGKKSCVRHQNWKIRNTEKIKIIKAARKKYQNNKIKKLANGKKDRFYYQTLNEMMDVTFNKKNIIHNVIHPKYAINESDIDRNKATMEQYASTAYQTANVFNNYFNTIGNPKNANYKTTLKTHRKKARNFDRPYNFDEYDSIKYKKEIMRLNQPIIKSELRCHAMNLKNNKKVWDYDGHNDNIHTIILKEALPVIDEHTLIIFNH